MKRLFTNILVPISRMRDASITIDEVIRLARQLQCQVHFLVYTAALEEAGLHKFDSFKEYIQQHCRLQAEPLAFSPIISRQTGHLVKGLLEYYNRNTIDLILLGRRSRTTAVHATRLLEKVDCPVLTTNSQPMHSRLRNIVLPVGDHLPRRKLLFAAYLARITHSTIHLVAATGKPGDPDERSMESLQKSYRLLRENTDLSIQCMSMSGGNLAEVTWNYARDIKADLIMVNPGKEALLSGFLNGLRAKYLPGVWSRSLLNKSRIPVMSIG
jgi:nucleotide-binding universal stress UspA family protein